MTSVFFIAEDHELAMTVSYGIMAASNLTNGSLVNLNMGTRRIFPGWTIRGSEGRKFPSRVQGQLPGGGLGTKLSEADDIFSK